MHEFSIAVNIVDIVTETAEAQGAKQVNEIELEIGELSGVILEAMETAMESATQGTWLESSKIIIHTTKGRGQCRQCKHSLTSVIFLIHARNAVPSTPKSYLVRS